MIVQKKRRGRKERIRGLNGSEKTSSSGAPLTSSSGAQVDSNAYCDYNPGHLKTQYTGFIDRQDDYDDYWGTSHRNG